MSKNNMRTTNMLRLMFKVLITIGFEMKNKENEKRKEREFNERSDCWNNRLVYVAQERYDRSSV